MNDVVELQATQIEPPPRLGPADDMRFLVAIGKGRDRVIFLIDVYQALSSREIF